MQPPSCGRKLALAWSATETVAHMKVAFATSDRVIVDQHFGASAGFAIYGVDAERAHLIEVVEFKTANDDVGGESPEVLGGSSHNRLAEKIATLAGCAAVYCLAVGGAAVRQLMAGGIQPMRLDDPLPIEEILSTLCRAVRDGGVAWIERARARQRSEDDRVRLTRLADEAWEE